MSTPTPEIIAAQAAKQETRKQEHRATNRAAGRRVRRPAADARVIATGKRGRPTLLSVDARIPTVAIANALLAFAQSQIAIVEKQYSDQAAAVPNNAAFAAFCKANAAEASAAWRDTVANIRAGITRTAEKTK